MQGLPLLGAQVLQPETDDALALLFGTGCELGEPPGAWGALRAGAGPTWEVKKRISLSTFS